MYCTHSSALQEILARNYGLAAQLNCLNYYNLCEQRLADGRSPRWVLADLRRSDIQRLQKSAKEGYTGRSALRNTLEQVKRVRPLDYTLHTGHRRCSVHEGYPINRIVNNFMQVCCDITSRSRVKPVRIITIASKVYMAHVA